MNVLFSTHTSPDYMPPLVISERQIIVGPSYPNRVEAGLVCTINVALGSYDLAALVSSLPEEQAPELIVVLADAFQHCVPKNLAVVRGQKVLLVGDTHHGTVPLRTTLSYARQEKFDRIAVIHDPHHLHWFTEAGIAPVAYLPNINCFNFPQDFNEHRQPAIVFVGQVTKGHLRRRYLLEAIQNAGLPLIVRQAPAQTAAATYNATQITFNCSLNGDLNMRVFEVMAAGGFLVTDRLSPQAGLETFFRRGVDYVDYENPDDLLEKLRYYLARPDECLKIARAGQEAYRKAHLPMQRVQDLLEFASGKSSSLLYNNDLRAVPGGAGFGENLEERICLYEFFQNVSLQNERAVVVADVELGARVIADLIDLPRLKIKVRRVVGRSSRVKDALNSLGVLDQIEFIGTRPVESDIQFVSADTLSRLRDRQDIRAPWLAVMAAGSSMVTPTAWLASQGFSKVSETPHLFRRTS